MKNIFSLLLLIFILSCENNAHQHEQHQAPQIQVLNALPDKTVISSQPIVKPQYALSDSIIELKGYIVADERRTNKISLRVSGRIEKLLIKYPYQYVNKGDVILEIYSKELSKYVEEYLYFLNSNENELLLQAEEKLLLLGISKQQLADLEKTKKVPAVISVPAPQSGYILPFIAKENAMPGASSSKGDGMSGMNKNTVSVEKTTASASTWPREGMYVNKDQVLFAINDLNVVWGLALANHSGINVGDAATIVSDQNPGKTVQGKVDFVEPFFDKGQKFNRYRLYIENTAHHLQINSLFTTQIKIKTNKVLTIPASALLDLGQRKMVWIKTNQKGNESVFIAREVKVGESMRDKIVITGGLTQNDEIAEQAGYLLDSETLIK